MNTSDIAFVVCYFNPLNYLSKYLNFLLFYDKIQTYSVSKLFLWNHIQESVNLELTKM